MVMGHPPGSNIKVVVIKDPPSRVLLISEVVRAAHPAANLSRRQAGHREAIYLLRGVRPGGGKADFEAGEHGRSGAGADAVDTLDRKIYRRNKLVIMPRQRIAGTHNRK